MMRYTVSIVLMMLSTDHVVSGDFKGFEVVGSCLDPYSFNGGPLRTAVGHTATSCAILCSGETRCHSFTFRKSSSTCFLHHAYIPYWPCDKPGDIHYNDVYNPCLHGGDYNPGTSTCKCFGGYKGDICGQVIEDCSDGMAYYYGQKGEFIIQPNLSPQPFIVYCEMDFGGRTAILKQKTGNENFNRPWDDYKKGFGNVSGDHWLGNDYIHYISYSRKHSLLVQVETGSSYHQYFMQDFGVDDESSNYNLTFGSHFTSDKYHESLGDCLGPLYGSSFSTLDRDNDNSARNCAQDFQSGWWFKDCSTCNPTGVYEASPVGGQAGAADSNLHWTPGEGLGNRSPREMALYLVYNDPSTWG
ncbi:fibrinogen-like protein 1 [Haliotis rubra]|uniref:fibrinogen-like protein 1 n=1 Tax=Haliotis rubra TaxID=36100 RepID=UPI001EE53B6B|nr:fibrinogen-like protein 1 [Haliotis rubra]